MKSQSIFKARRRPAWRRPPDRGFARCRRLAIRIVAAIGLSIGVLIPPSRAAETLHPATALPDIHTVSAEDYYILLLKWARTVTIKPVVAKVVYLDPPLYLAWLKQTNPEVTQAEFARLLAGFPHVLTFRIAYQAADRRSLGPASWKVALVAADGKREPARSGHAIGPASLENDTEGTFWQEEWLYTFKVPGDFLRSSATGFALALTGPFGSGLARWQFGAVKAEVTHPDAYVPYLGAALLIFSALVLAGLILTRRPNRRV